MALPAAVQAYHGDSSPTPYLSLIGGYSGGKRVLRLVRDFEVDGYSVGSLQGQNEEQDEDDEEVVLYDKDLRTTLENKDTELEKAEIAGVTLGGNPDAEDVVQLLEADDELHPRAAASQEKDYGSRVHIYGHIGPLEPDEYNSEPNKIASLEYSERDQEQDNTVLDESSGKGLETA
jgi:hypothetical protein